MEDAAHIYPASTAFGGAFEPSVFDTSAISEHDFPRIVVLEGQSSTGKTTLAEMLSRRLGYASVTTGMLFCAGAAALEGADINSNDAKEVSSLIRATNFDFSLTPGGRPLLSIDGRDVSDNLFRQAHKQGAARFNAIPEITDYFEAMLRQLAATGRWVFDRGARVFPDADLKIWLAASTHTRAVRRCGQLALEGEYMSLEQVIAEQAVRSRRDRKNHRPPADAVTIDTTNLDTEEVYGAICSLILKSVQNTT